MVCWEALQIEPACFETALFNPMDPLKDFAGFPLRQDAMPQSCSKTCYWNPSAHVLNAWAHPLLPTERKLPGLRSTRPPDRPEPPDMRLSRPGGRGGLERCQELHRGEERGLGTGYTGTERDLVGDSAEVVEGGASAVRVLSRLESRCKTGSETPHTDKD